MTIQELEQCINLYGKDLYSFCIYLTRKKELADDLYQDTFLEAMKKIVDIRYRENPKGYLLSMVFHIWRNKKRKLAWRQRIVPEISEEDRLERISSNDETLLDGIIVEEERRLLQNAVDNLPEKLKVPILLYYMEDLSITEISQVMELPSGTIKSRLHHARNQLKKELEDQL